MKRVKIINYQILYVLCRFFHIKQTVVKLVFLVDTTILNIKLVNSTTKILKIIAERCLKSVDLVHV